MLALVAILLFGIPVLMVAATLLAIFFQSLLMTMAVLRSFVGACLVLVLCATAATASYRFLTPTLRNVIPTFKTPGDGGWGIGIDLVVQSAARIVPPIAACSIVSALVFILAMSSQRPDQAD